MTQQRSKSLMPPDTGASTVPGASAHRDGVVPPLPPGDDRWLDQALHDLAGPALADAGFTARVMARLEGATAPQVPGGQVRGERAATDPASAAQAAAALARLAARRAHERGLSRFGLGGAAMGLGVSLAWLLAGMPVGGGLPVATALGLTAGLALCAGAMAWTVR